jgi:GYF domain 2
MDIHLARPGGQREGPFSLEEINANIAARKFRDSDYWAWYEGLHSWVPLHQVPGIIDAGKSLTQVSAPEPPVMPGGDTEFIQQPAADAANPKKFDPSKLSSGMPVQALEQVFVFTNGEGPAVMQSPVTSQLLREIIGADFEVILKQAPRDVFGRCSIPAQLAEHGKVPASAWHAMSALKPEITQQARDGSYRICVRTFEIEAGQQVAVFLFYKKQEG